MEVHIPTFADATPGIEIGGSLRPRLPVPARRRRPGGRGPTYSRATTSAVADMHVRLAISRTRTSVSHVRLRFGIGRVARRLPVIASHPKIAKLRHTGGLARFRP